MALGLLVPFASKASSISPGDLIKGIESSSVYFYAEDGHRWVFPNEKVFFSWYANGAWEKAPSQEEKERIFSAVKTISMEELALIPLGKNVTYHPGFKMLKMVSDPKVYYVDQPNVLRWVTTESLARQEFGDERWFKIIDDLSEAFFMNYQMGNPIVSRSDFHSIDTGNIGGKTVAENLQRTINLIKGK